MLIGSPSLQQDGVITIIEAIEFIYVLGMKMNMVFTAFCNMNYCLICWIFRTQAESKQIPQSQCQEAEIVASTFHLQMFLG